MQEARSYKLQPFACCTSMQLSALDNSIFLLSEKIPNTWQSILQNAKEVINSIPSFGPQGKGSRAQLTSKEFSKGAPTYRVSCRNLTEKYLWQYPPVLPICWGSPIQQTPTAHPNLSCAGKTRGLTMLNLPRKNDEVDDPRKQYQLSRCSRVKGHWSVICVLR